MEVGYKSKITVLLANNPELAEWVQALQDEIGLLKSNLLLDHLYIKRLENQLMELTQHSTQKPSQIPPECLPR